MTGPRRDVHLETIIGETTNSVVRRVEGRDDRLDIHRLAAAGRVFTSLVLSRPDATELADLQRILLVTPLKHTRYRIGDTTGTPCGAAECGRYRKAKPMQY